MNTQTLSRWQQNTQIAQIAKLAHTALSALDNAGRALGPLALRLLLAVEFATSGLEKLHGDNWFADIQDQFPFPFNVIPADISWQMATWTELMGAALLVFGLGTRFASVSLIVVTLVATAAVHWPAQWHTLSELAQGYAITDDGHGNFKLPLMYLVMFVPLLLQGAGLLSVDHFFRRKLMGHTGHMGHMGHMGHSHGQR